jgi:hypothetical protein
MLRRALASRRDQAETDPDEAEHVVDVWSRTIDEIRGLQRSRDGY